MEKIRLVIAEGRTLFRQGLTALLRECADFEVVGEAASAEETRLVCTRLMPDLVLLSRGLAASSAAPDLLDALRVCCPCAVPILLEDGAATPDAAMEAGREESAEGAPVLCADIDRQELYRALRAAVLPLPSSRPAPFPLNPVTEREQEIIALIAEGLCNKEIARRLSISTQTVKNHVSHLLEKLSVVDRTQLAVYAIAHHFDFSQSEASPKSENTLAPIPRTAGPETPPTQPARPQSEPRRVRQGAA